MREPTQIRMRTHAFNGVRSTGGWHSAGTDRLGGLQSLDCSRHRLRLQLEADPSHTTLHSIRHGCWIHLREESTGKRQAHDCGGGGGR